MLGRDTFVEDPLIVSLSLRLIPMQPPMLEPAEFSMVIRSVCIPGGRKSQQPSEWMNKFVLFGATLQYTTTTKLTDQNS